MQRFKIIFLISILIILIVEHLFSQESDNFIDVGFKIFKPLHDTIRTDEYYLFRVFLLLIQTVIILLIILNILFNIIIENSVATSYKILSMYAIRIVAMISFILPNR
jgi:hypothetical protein